MSADKSTCPWCEGDTSHTTNTCENCGECTSRVQARSGGLLIVPVFRTVRHKIEMLKSGCPILA